MQIIDFDIEGMTCNGCVAGVLRVLEGVAGVEGVTVTLAPPRARVTFDERRANVQQLRSAVEDAGYGVRV
ncbi:MAG: heavy-metal-associated domain-containing protein [Betaproteobacteria bacterium]